MSLSFLICANVVLLCRLGLFFRDEPPTARAWAWAIVTELGMLVAAFEFSTPLLAAAGATLAVNLVGRWRETRPGPRNLARWTLGALHLAALSVCTASAHGMAFRPFWTEAGQALARHTTLAPYLFAVGSPAAERILFALLLSANEANLLIRAVFERLDLKPRRTAGPDRSIVDEGEFNRGRIIGVLERVLLCFFILQGQFGAIGFVLAAKAFTRFKALDDRPFAEYVLIGTLLSACLALAIGILVRVG